MACLAHQHWLKAPQENGKLFLGSLFLADRARVNSRRKGLAYTLTFNVRVPDYEVERKLWVNQHFEGSYLFRNSLVLEITPPSDDSGWQVSHAWQNQGCTAPTINSMATSRTMEAWRSRCRLTASANPASAAGCVFASTLEPPGLMRH